MHLLLPVRHLAHVREHLLESETAHRDDAEPSLARLILPVSSQLRGGRTQIVSTEAAPPRRDPVLSQGTMMALHVGLRRSRQIAAIVGYSGMLTGGHELSHLPITKPPVLLVHGSADPIVPVAALHAAKAELEHLGVDVTAHISTGVGHSVDPVGLRMGGEFIARALSDQN